MSITSNYLSSDHNLKSDYGVHEKVPQSMNNSIAGLTLVPKTIDGKAFKNLKQLKSIQG